MIASVLVYQDLKPQRYYSQTTTLPILRENKGKVKKRKNAFFLLKNVFQGDLTTFAESDKIGVKNLVLSYRKLKKKAEFIAERIRKKIFKARFKIKDKTVKITIIGGVNQLNAKLPDKNASIANADKALYQAKGKGRNRVVVYKG